MERAFSNFKAGNKPKKKALQDSQMVVAPILQVKGGQPGDQDKGWQTVGKKTKGKLKKKNKSADALLISAKADTSYADILRKVKKDLTEIEAEGTIEKVRRAIRGQLMIVLNWKISDEVGSLYGRMAEVLKEEAEVTCKKNEVDLEIRDIEEITSAKEAHAALVEASRGCPDIPSGAAKSLREAYGKTQVAFVRLPAETAQRIMGETGKIRIGLVNCSVRDVNRPLRCYKCWHVGHMASQCKSDIDRSELGIKCGDAGHKVSQCKNKARCALCIEK